MEKIMLLSMNNMKDKKKVLFYATEGGGIGTIFDDIWYNSETVVDEAEF